MKYYKRTLEDSIIKTIKTFPVTLITGSRQVGKTHTCLSLKDKLGFNYVSFEDINIRFSAKKDPIDFLKTYNFPLIIDEVQYVPEIFDAIFKMVNEEKRKNSNNHGMYILTGSEVFPLMENITQSLSGRVGIIEMSPLSLSEINEVEEKAFTFDIKRIYERTKDYKISKNDIFDIIVKGFYPGLYERDDIDIDMFYKSYITSYIEKDIRSLINIKDLKKFNDFMIYLASTTGAELNINKISNLIEVDNKTINNWLSILIATDIVYLVNTYKESSIRKRIIKRPKLYFSDTGLASHLLGIRDGNILKKLTLSGAFFETFIVGEIRKSYRNNNIRPKLYFYRDNNQNEVDLLVFDNAILHLIEIKQGSTYNESNIKGFKAITTNLFNIGTSGIICNTDVVYKISDNNYSIPFTGI